MRVEKELSESMVTRILDSVENAAASKPQPERFITKFARIYTPFVVALAAATAIIPSLITGNWSHWIYTALTFLVISCPVRPCFKRSAGILLRDRRRFQERNPL